MSEVISTAFENQQSATPVKQGAEPSYPYLVYESQEDLDRLEAALTELRKTKTGAKLIADATEHKTPIRLDRAMRAYGSYDEVTNDLKINANNDENRMVGTLAHELRHAQQFQKGILLDAYLDTPKTYIQNQAAIEADASATSCAVCYELALQGNDKPLEALRQKDPHIVNPFQNAAVKGGLADGSAYQAGFKGWFTDYCTRDSYDILYIKMARQRRSNCTREEEAKKFERVVPVADVVEKVCTCNAVHEPQGNRRVFLDPRREHGVVRTVQQHLCQLLSEIRSEIQRHGKRNEKQAGTDHASAFRFHAASAENRTVADSDDRKPSGAGG